MSQEISSPVPETLDPPPASPQMNHGRTVAGWFLFWVACVGAIVIAVGAVQYNWVTIGVGAAIIAVGLLGSVVLRKLGYGQPASKAAAPTVEDL